MPIYIELQNLIVPKEVLKTKYKGGIEQFRKWFEENTGTASSEDNELFSIARMNDCGEDIVDLIDNELDYNTENQNSDDFSWVARYGGEAWETSWLESNGVFAWHKDSHPEKVKLAQEIAETHIDDIKEAMERGENPLDTIY